MRSAPARWYFADTPAAHRAGRPGSLAGNERLAVGPAGGLADNAGRLPGLKARLASR